jgi:hypothetical protein
MHEWMIFDYRRSIQAMTNFYRVNTQSMGVVDIAQLGMLVSGCYD